jgi:hypothetical protein
VAGDSDGQIKPQDAFDGERRPTGPVLAAFASISAFKRARASAFSRSSRYN